MHNVALPSLFIPSIKTQLMQEPTMTNPTGREEKQANAGIYTFIQLLSNNIQ